MARIPILAIVMFILIAPSALAVGISGPLKPTFVFEPGLEINMTYMITNSASFAQNISVSLYADKYYCCADTTDEMNAILRNSSRLSWTSQYLEPGQGKPLEIYIKFPLKMDSPGIHGILIRAGELGIPGAGISAVAAVRTPFFVFVRYPGKHIEIGGLNAPDVEAGKEETFHVAASSKGTDRINEAYSTITVSDSKNKTVATVRTDSEPMDVDSSIELVGKWNTTGQSDGIYHAVAEVNYDGLTMQTNPTQFRIGNLNLTITNYTREAIAGAINPFEIQVESRWNDVIKDVYAVIKIRDKGQVLMTFQTPTIEVQPWKGGTLSGYFDASLPKGKYDMDIDLYFQDRHESVSDQMTIVEKGLLMNRLLTPFAIFTLLLVMNLLLWLIWVWKKRKRPGNPGNISTQEASNETR